MSQLRRLAALSLVGAVASATTVVQAWEPLDSSRPVWSGTVPYRLNSAGSVDLGGFSPAEAEVRRAMDDWTLVACTDLANSYGGSSSRAPTNGDGESTIGWRESSWSYDSNAIGVTTPQYLRNITEADMELNGVNFTWTTAAGRGSSVNTYSIVLHEGGHYYGLGHSSDASATMYYAYSGGISTLNTDDENGICALYPGSGSDCTTTGCPSGYECTGGTCVRMMGDGDTCSPCDSGTACTSGVCLGYPDGNGYCSRACTTSADCGGDTCVAIDGAGNQCVRVRGSTPDCSGTAGCRTDSDCSATERCNAFSGECIPRAAGGAIGTACGAGADCSSGVCFNGACSQSCDWLDPSSCPGGFYCNGQATGTCGSGLCLAGSAGGGGLGDACGSATDCQSLFCAEGVCSVPCIPGGVTSCPTGTACQMGVTSDCGSCQQAGALGDACMTNEDCSSRMCAAQAGSSFCTSFCDAGSPCPDGFACVAAGASSVCVPSRGGLGAPCTANADCAGNICAAQNGATTCTRTCDAVNTCPRDYDCVLTSDGVTSVCQAHPRTTVTSGGCGRCAASAGSSGPLAWASLSLLGLLLAARRRARRAR